MSKTELTASGEAQDERSTDSVYDFLYNDARRVGSFLAQIDYFGHLQQVTSTETASRGGKRGYSFKLGGSVPVPGSPEGAEASLTYARDPEGGGSEGLSRVYDPLWTNAVTLLDFLDERGLVQRDITKARLGQFVLLTGKLSIVDYGLARAIWGIPGIKKIAAKALGKTIGADESDFKSALGSPEARADFVVGFLKMLPYPVQVMITGKEGTAWGSLDTGSLSGTTVDLILKHGHNINGTWAILGVLDAIANEPDEKPPEKPDAITSFRSIFGLSGFIRQHFGRQQNQYGVTPLLIFREISR